MLQLVQITRQGELRKYTFEEHSRPGYCARAATLYVNAQFQLEAMRLNSAHFGIVTWSKGRGITESTAWQDEATDHLQPGHRLYYSASSTIARADISHDVAADVLASAPDSSFRDMVRAFMSDTDASPAYPYQNYRLAPPQTTGQIHVLRYVPKISNEDRAELTWQSFGQFVRRYLNPLAMSSAASKEVRESLDRVQYECQNCGAQNSLLQSSCAACGSRRPKLPLTVIARYMLRATIDMTYVLYVAVCLGFLLLTMFRALKYSQFRIY